MAKEEPPLVYWDACIFIDYIEGPPAGHPILLMRDALLAKPQRVRVVTSVLSIAEVAFGKEEKDGLELDEAVESKINELWEPTSPIELIDAYAELCHQARQFNRQLLAMNRRRLKGADSLHLASALSMKDVKEFHTGNGKLQRLRECAADLVPFEILSVRDVSLPPAAESTRAEDGGLFAE